MLFLPALVRATCDNSSSSVLPNTDLWCRWPKDNATHGTWCTDLAQAPASTPAICCALCKTNATAGGACTAWSFNQGAQKCFLKGVGSAGFGVTGYATPSSDTSGRMLSPSARARELVSRMNLTEKISMACGVDGLGWGPPEHPYVGNVPALPRVGIPWLSLQDGPQGYRDGKYGHYGGAPGTSTQWPSGMTVAATFDAALAFEWGVAMGAEFKAKGANVQLGPGMNLARIPRGGRNFEYISGEDLC